MISSNTNTNLYNETLEALRHNDKTFNDVRYVSGGCYRISINNFIEVAKKTNYDCGYGSQKIAVDLMIIGDDWWMSRGEYDGSESWDFMMAPKVEDRKLIEVCSLGGNDNHWDTLRDINEQYSTIYDIRI